MFEFLKELLNQVFKPEEVKKEPVLDKQVEKPQEKPAEIIKLPINQPNPEYAKMIGTKDWYAVEYHKCKTLPKWSAQAREAAHKIIHKRDRYSFVTMHTSVPWQLIGGLHYRESSFDWNSCLHNGDPLGKKTVKVPAGRGPFHSWEDAAIDALMYEMNLLRKIGWKPDWSIEGCLDFAERYNGLGYRRKGIMSCYLFSCVDTMRARGRYTYDGVYNPLATTQDYLGIIPILKEIEAVSDEYKLKRTFTIGESNAK
jgi:lysozyme family protein